MADEVSYNPDLFTTTDAGELAVKAPEKAWPYPGVNLSQGNGLKWDKDGLFVDVPPTLSMVSEVWNATDGAGPIDVADGASGALIIPQVSTPVLSKASIVFGGWRVQAWYTFGADAAPSVSGYVALSLTDGGGGEEPSTLPLTASGTLLGPTGQVSAFVPVDDDVSAGAAWTTKVAASVDNHTGVPITVNWRAHFAAYVMEGVTQRA